MTTKLTTNGAPRVDAEFYGGHPHLGDDEAYVRNIPLVQNDRWEWVLQDQIETHEWPSGRLTGRFVLIRKGERPAYRWEPSR